MRKAEISLSKVLSKGEGIASLKPLILLNLELEQLRSLITQKLDLSDLADSTGYDLTSYDLDLYEIRNELLLFKRKPKIKEEVLILKVDKRVLFNDETSRALYQAVLMDSSGKKVSIQSDNFYYLPDKNRLATKDYRVVIDGHSGDVPKADMQMAATAAVMVLSGQMDSTSGLMLIKSIMGKYGQVSFDFCMYGYMHVSVNAFTSKSEVTFKQYVNMVKNPFEK